MRWCLYQHPVADDHKMKKAEEADVERIRAEGTACDCEAMPEPSRSQIFINKRLGLAAVMTLEASEDVI